MLLCTCISHYRPYMLLDASPASCYHRLRQAESAVFRKLPCRLIVETALQHAKQHHSSLLEYKQQASLTGAGETHYDASGNR